MLHRPINSTEESWFSVFEEYKKRLQKDLVILNSPALLNRLLSVIEAIGVQENKEEALEEAICEMAGSVLRMSEAGSSEYSNMYQVIKFTDNLEFWAELIMVYGSPETGSQMAFIDWSNLCKHASAAREVYRDRGIHRIEAILLSE